jgi:predicted Rossmann-fold nucleotide-binding protein
MRNVPWIFVGDLWQDLGEWARRHMLSGDPQLASPEDLEIPHCVESVEEACAIISENLALFNRESTAG